MLTSTELRAKYTEFFVDRGHAVIPSASLVPANDPTVLFTTAGMHPLVPYLLGEPHPAGTRLVDVQRCIRTGDIDAVGDDTHLTFFEMLGNWSLGDYGRDEAIAWSFEFLTGARWLGLPLARLGVTCFAGDGVVPRDDASIARWRGLGVPASRIQLLGRDDNWWGPAGRTGPCGPDTEMFYWVGDGAPPDTLDVRDRRWVEIWNDVFMGYTVTASGDVAALARGNVDTGMGLERALVAINGLSSVYDVDTMSPLVGELRRLAGREDEHALRVVADHVRAAGFAIADGIAPSNKDRGYVVRRLVRRALVFARELGLSDGWHRHALGVLPLPPEVVPVVDDELRRFDASLAQGQRVLDRLPALDGQAAFDLFQTYGFPFELAFELAEAAGKPVDRAGVADALERHRAQSRTTSAGSFAGGLADHSEDIVRYHTLTHLLQAALRAVLGPHVIQRGSNITHERLRFDFSHDGKPTSDELARVEAMVNAWLARPFVVERAVMSGEAARAIGAIGAFGEKYGETSSVYTIRDGDTVISRELCGGPHVRSASELRGQFRIAREQAVSAGVRRIKAVLA